MSTNLQWILSRFFCVNTGASNINDRHESAGEIFYRTSDRKTEKFSVSRFCMGSIFGLGLPSTTLFHSSAARLISSLVEFAISASALPHVSFLPSLHFTTSFIMEPRA